MKNRIIQVVFTRNSLYIYIDIKELHYIIQIIFIVFIIHDIMQFYSSLSRRIGINFARIRHVQISMTQG